MKNEWSRGNSTHKRTNRTPINFSRLRCFYVLRELIIERMREKYGRRDRRIIYAHNLDQNIIYTLMGVKSSISNEMIMGELIHLGVSTLLRDGIEKCDKIQIKPEIAMILNDEIKSRFINERDGILFVYLCGTPDALTPDGKPIELKTTRSKQTIRPEWVSRIETYTWLYRKDGILIILNVITGEERVIPISKINDEEMKKRIELWLRGEYPRKLQTLGQYST